jgi:hypothetical protein
MATTFFFSLCWTTKTQAAAGAGADGYSKFKKADGNSDAFSF